MKLINIYENNKKNQKLSFWDFVDSFNIDHDLRSYMHDKWVDWHNNHRKGAILVLLKNPVFKTISHLELFFDTKFGKYKNRMEKAASRWPCNWINMVF